MRLILVVLLAFGCSNSVEQYGVCGGGHGYCRSTSYPCVRVTEQALDQAMSPGICTRYCDSQSDCGDSRFAQCVSIRTTYGAGACLRTCFVSGQCIDGGRCSVAQVYPTDRFEIVGVCVP